MEIVKFAVAKPEGTTVGVFQRILYILFARLGEMLLARKLFSRQTRRARDTFDFRASGIGSPESLPCPSSPFDFLTVESTFTPCVIFFKRLLVQLLKKKNPNFETIFRDSANLISMPKTGENFS